VTDGQPLDGQLIGLLGLKLAVAPAGSPEVARVALPFPFDVMLTVYVTEVAPYVIVREVGESETAVTLVAALTYGPTNGPPPPTGGAPAGTTGLVEGSPSARSTFRRPLPVSDWVPAASAFRASRPTMVPFEADGSFACSSAAAPATMAAAADVPVMEVVPPPGESAGTSTPGAARNVSSPELLPLHRASAWFVAETPTTLASPAGKCAVDDPSFPVAATSTTPWSHANVMASCSAWLNPGLLKPIRMTSAPLFVAHTTPLMMSLSWPTPEASSTWTGMMLALA